MSTPASSARVALLDTSVQVDRVKSGARRLRIEGILGGFELRVTTSIALLEFKATVLQECITIYNRLRRDGRFTAVRDALVESSHRQSRLRAHIFNNLLNVFSASSFDVTPEMDRRLAEKAQLYLGDQIPRLYRWFRTESVDAILDTNVRCTRADEPPQRKRVAFTANLPICKRGKNKHCDVEGFLRRESGDLCDFLDALDDRPEQFERALALFKSVRDESAIDVSHSECRNAGDCLIALEARRHATHALSTNPREWSLLSDCLKFEFIRVEYPDERGTSARGPDIP